MEEITLQLRQEDASDITQNGVFSTTLNRPIILEEGDEVSIKSATLNVIGDTIQIPDGGLDISLTGLKYLVNYNINRNMKYAAHNTVFPNSISPLMSYTNFVGTTPPGSAATGDNALYWLANAHKNTNAHTPYYMVNVNVFPLTRGRGGKRYGGNITVNYTSPDDPTNILGQTVSVHCASYQEDEFKKHQPLPIPSQAREANPTEFITIKCAEIGGAPSVSVSNEQYLPALNISKVTFPEDSRRYPVQPITPSSTDYEIDPQQFKWTATIPEGDYTPQEMSAVLTDLLVPLEVNGAISSNYNHEISGGTTWDSAAMKFPSSSPFLETILQNERALASKNTADTDNVQCFTNASIQKSATDPTLKPTAGQVVQQFEIAAMKADYIAPDPSTLTAYNPPVDRWVGTNDISISYDENENKMKFDTIHFPVFTNSTGDTAGSLAADAKPGLIFNQLAANNPNADANADTGVALAYSGVAFTDMSPSTFWEDQLGFSNNTVVVNPNSCSVNFAKDMNGVLNSFTIDNVIPGQTITQAMASLDVPVVNSSDRQYPPGGATDPVSFTGAYARPIADLVGDPGTGTQVSTDDTVAIFGGKTFNQQIETAGYFLIDIANNFQTEFVGGRVSTQQSTTAVNGQNTMGIVGRYYTSNNFLTNQGGGNIVYTHPEGAKPQMLTDLAVRVKNPDGSFVAPSILGERNTVFLTIQRAAPAVNQPTGSKKSAE